MITMLSTIGNRGIYIKPHLLKQVNLKKEDGTIEYKTIEKEEGEQVISEENAKNVLSMMQTVVQEGTGKKAQVEGYNIGGKTGTSEDGVNTGKFIASFIGIGPIEKPSLAILVTLYNPKGQGGHSGGGIGAPLAGNILREVLEYLK
jgi:stage V sporulation protein D (sporulation-specific penicillin-binding protein)